MTYKKYKVMIIDDDKFLLDIYAIKFKEEGFDVETTVTAEDALQKLSDKNNKFDIVLLDMVMPGMDGIAFLDEMKKRGIDKDIVKIVLSNQSQSEDIEKAKSYGIDGYIVKASLIPSEVLKEVYEIAENKLNK